MTTSPTFLRRSFAGLALFLTATALPSQAFEGKIDMAMTDSRHPQEPHVIHYTIKDRKFRTDMTADSKNKSDGSGTVGMVVDGDKRQMIMLMQSTDKHGNTQKMAMRQTLPDPADMAAARSGDHTSEMGSPPVATGRTEMIAGYPASEYRMTDRNGNISEIWLAKGLGSFMMPQQNPRSRPVPAGWEAFAARGEFFPLRVVTHDSAGTEKAKMEVTKIDKSSVPDSTFSTEGYTEIQLPTINGKSLMQGLLGR